MYKHALLIAFAIGCTNSPDRMLPGDTGDSDLAFRGATNPCSATSDFESDGVTDINWTYFYDERGRSKKDVGKYTSLENPDDLYTYTYDNADHLTSMIQNAGGIDVWRYDATYNTLGDQLDLVYSDFSEPTMPSIDRTTYHDFDDHGHAAFSIQTITGASDAKHVYAYDELGRLIENATDNNGDSIADTVATTVYDDAAHTTTTTTITVGDTRHTVRIRHYDTALHLLNIHRDSFASDGKLSTFDLNYEWDGDRLMTSTFAFNGATSSTDRYSYSCD